METRNSKPGFAAQELPFGILFADYRSTNRETGISSFLPMRIRRRKLLLGGLLFVVLVILVWGIMYLSSRHEPVYQGKSLSQWIAPFCVQTTTNPYAPAGPQHFQELQPTRRAITEIGTNALPFLIAKLNHREAPLHRTLRQLADKQPYVGLRLADPRVARIRAIRALAVLGPVAEPAIPSLAAQLRDPLLSEHAVYALSGMGRNGLRALIDNFTNAAPSARMLIGMTLSMPSAMYRGENQTNAIPTDVAVEGLSRIIQDSGTPFRIMGIQRLGMMGPTASNAVPALLAVATGKDLMTRNMATRALGQIKSQPDLVIPALTNLLSDGDPSVRMAAVSALREYGYDAQFQPMVPNSFPTPPQYIPPTPQRYVPGSTNMSVPQRYGGIPFPTNGPQIPSRLPRFPDQR
jgi:hypothetical protein